MIGLTALDIGVRFSWGCAPGCDGDASLVLGLASYPMPDSCRSSVLIQLRCEKRPDKVRTHKSDELAVGGFGPCPNAVDLVWVMLLRLAGSLAQLWGKGVWTRSRPTKASSRPVRAAYVAKGMALVGLDLVQTLVIWFGRCCSRWLGPRLRPRAGTAGYRLQIGLRGGKGEGA